MVGRQSLWSGGGSFSKKYDTGHFLLLRRLRRRRRARRRGRRGWQLLPLIRTSGTIHNNIAASPSSSPERGHERGRQGGGEEQQPARKSHPRKWNPAERQLLVLPCPPSAEGHRARKLFYEQWDEFDSISLFIRHRHLCRHFLHSSLQFFLLRTAVVDDGLHLVAVSWVSRKVVNFIFPLNE